jgi:hypothetical protein
LIRPAHITSSALFVLLLCASCVLAATDDEPAIPPGLDAAFSNGLDFLVAQQGADGSIGPAGGPRLATTALSLLSFLAGGNAPDLGRYGSTVRGAIDFLVIQGQPDGYFGKVDGSRMYGQGIVTLALAEAYGVEDSDDGRQKIYAVLLKSVKLILDAQSVKKADVYAGGWRYEPQATDSDISLCGWNALALRAAKSVGIAVPPEAVEKAVQFVLRCHNPQGGFGYQPGTQPLPSATGVGVLCLYLLNSASAERPEIADSLKFLKDHPVDDQSNYLFYTIYYATQAAFQAGNAAYAAIAAPNFDRLFKSQQADGGWPDPRGQETGGRIYTTSMALLVLGLPYRLLPIYQR